MSQSSGHSSHNPAVVGLIPTLTTGWISFSFVASFIIPPPGSQLVCFQCQFDVFSNFYQLFTCSLQLFGETITLPCCCENGFGSCLIQSVITFMIKPIIGLLLCSCPILLITHDYKLNWTPLSTVTIIHFTGVLLQSFLLRCAAHPQLSMDLTFIGFFNQVLMPLICYLERSLYSTVTVFSVCHFHISQNASYLPAKFCISIVFNLSWDGCNTQEK